MVTGHQPFPETNAAELVGAILHRELALEPLGIVGPIVECALCKDALDHHAHAGLLARELAALRRPLGSDPTADISPAPAPGVHNFPIQSTRFIGREDEIRHLCAALGESRQVTLTGAGGIGKTRLALEVAAAIVNRFADGARLVDLATLADLSLVAAAVAETLGVREQPNRPIAERVCAHLRSRRLLLVLDNCEHLIKACAAIVQQILSSCPGTAVIATSRETLNVSGETLLRLRSLTVPDADDGR
jgi:non-specific serine/threonine protein kinase